MDAIRTRDRFRWLLAVVAALAVAAPTVATTGPTTRPLSDVLELLRSGRPDRATLSGPAGNVTITVTTGSRSVESAIPYSQLIGEVVAAARAGRVTLATVTPTAPQAGIATVDSGPGIGASIERWAPLALLALLVLVSALALRQVGGARFRQQVRPVRSETSFDDVAGIDEIRDEVSEIADVLRNPGRYERVGARVPKGVILHGAPGTGKTLLARAVAGEADVPFFSASGSEFVEVYSGLGAKRVRALFDAARKAAPSVVYIDEIDAVGGKRTGAPGSGEREQALDQLLSEMDGMRTNADRPVVVLASTNRLDDLDAALIRAGRFDRRIAVGLPDRAARESILGVHTRGRPLASGVRLADIAAFTAGMAGADLAALCNEAAFEAARDHRERIEPPDFRRALMRLAAGPERRGRPMLDEERRLVAFHEMGHAIVGHMLPSCDPLERVTVIPQGHALGVTVSLPTEDRFLATRRDCLDRLAMLMGGRAAEELVFGEPTSGAADDLRRALVLARRMVDEFAMSAEMTVISLGQATNEEDRERGARDLVAGGLIRANELLLAHRALLDEGAERLLASEALERGELMELLGPRPDGARLGSLPVS